MHPLHRHHLWVDIEGTQRQAVSEFIGCHHRPGITQIIHQAVHNALKDLGFIYQAALDIQNKLLDNFGLQTAALTENGSRHLAGKSQKHQHIRFQDFTAFGGK